jgi:tetratricopeptide (TPR) repeat protein
MVWRNGETLSQHCIDVDPSNFMARSALASYYVNTRQLDKARAACDETLKLNPNYPPGHEYLGNIYYLQGDYAKAAKELEYSLKIDPFKRDVDLRLGDVFLREGEAQRAEEQYRTYLAYDAADPSAHCGLGKALVLEGKLNDACAEFAAAFKIIDSYPEAHYELGSALGALGQRAAAAEQFRKTLQYDPNNADAMNNIAWILAAAPDPSLRNGTNAVSLAERACRITGNRQPLFIGTLADAYAEAGRFDEAVATAQRAHDVALAQTNDPVAARNLQLMELYKAHRAYHEE